MTKLLLLGPVALALALSPVVAAEDDAEEYEKRVQRINALAEKPGMMKIALQRVSTETGVPLEQVQAQHKRHPDVGAAGLLIANVLANETKKPPSQFIRQRLDGKRWLAQARQNKVSIDKLNDRLERFQKALTTGSGEKRR